MYTYSKNVEVYTNSLFTTLYANVCKSFTESSDGCTVLIAAGRKPLLHTWWISLSLKK